MMKKFSKIWIGLITIIMVTASCDNMLDVDSERFVLPEKNPLNSKDDAIFGMNGIFKELSNLADRYILLGELRGDLMDVSDNAGSYLQEINDFNFSESNPFIDRKDYYSVINNCNYFIQNIDTSLIEQAEKILYRDYAEAKAIRAWTYMQLALNFGSVKYYEKPILSVTEAQGEFQVYTLNELVDVLIQDLLPWRNMDTPESSSFGEDVTSGDLYFPVHFVLGDLYLWKGDFESAAQEYYDLMVKNEYLLNTDHQSAWFIENNAFTNSLFIDWRMIFDFGSSENISLIANSTEFGEGSLLDTLSTQTYEIVPSAQAVQNWENQTYYHSAKLSKEGDLRGHYGSYIDYSKYSFSTFSGNMIKKYRGLTSQTSKAIIIYRIGLLYLRYAEAVNRSGKPNLAFATIKNGLNSITMRTDTIVPPSEKYISTIDSVNKFFPYTNFEDVIFDDNIGVRARGCGNVNLDADFVIPALGSKMDSIEYVEDLIVNELALETAFEGNRFQDLMRISLRRNDPSYLANKVAEKHTNNKESIRAKLIDMNNWYLPAK